MLDTYAPAHPHQSHNTTTQQDKNTVLPSHVQHKEDLPRSSLGMRLVGPVDSVVRASESGAAVMITSVKQVEVMSAGATVDSQVQTREWPVPI